LNVIKVIIMVSRRKNANRSTFQTGVLNQFMQNIQNLKKKRRRSKWFIHIEVENVKEVEGEDKFDEVRPIEVENEVEDTFYG